MSKRNNSTLLDMFAARKTKRSNIERKGKDVVPDLSTAEKNAIVDTKKVEKKREEPVVPTQKEKEIDEKKRLEEIRVKEIEKLPYRKELAELENADRKNGNHPFAIYKTVHYEPRGVSNDTLQTQFGKSPRDLFNENVNNCKVYQFVRDNFEIPENFDQSLRFGARSGKCHEERVCSAYEDGLLKAVNASCEDVKLCRRCGNEGHFLFDCPSLLEQ